MNATRTHEAGNPRDVLLAGAVPVLCLLPFVAKGVHIDDTVYLRVAEQIQRAPLDFFGFQMNWLREPEWVYDFNRNPPGISYYIAAIATIAGWGVIPLHLGFLVPVFLAGAGAYRLATHFTDRPLAAALAGSLTPAFLVSNSNLMCEPFVAAFFTWSLVYWIEGLHEENRNKLAAAALLAGLGALMKYVTLSVVPLMAAYSVLHSRRVQPLAWLFIPVAVVAAYDAYAYYRYGVSLLFGAAGFAADRGATPGATALLRRTLVNLSFLGGGYLTGALWCWVALGWKRAVAFSAMVALIGVALIGFGGIDSAYRMYEGSQIRMGYALQLALFIAGGTVLLAMSVADVVRSRNAHSIVLLLWLGGIFVFSGYVNWTVNVRALIPAAPVIGILLARALPEPIAGWRVALPIGLAALVGFFVNVGDYVYAGAGRAAAVRSVDFRTESNANWFQGHWGFQYYMEENGFEHVSLEGVDPSATLGQSDLASVGLSPGDICVVKGDDWMVDLSGADSELIDAWTLPAGRFATTMSGESGAGFYDTRFGELPYYIGPAPAVEFRVYRVLQTGDAAASGTG